MKILVIGADTFFLNVIQHLLTDSGHQVKTSTKLEHGIAVAIDQQPNVIIADYEMSGGDDLKLLQMLGSVDKLADTRYVFTAESAFKLSDAFYNSFEADKVATLSPRPFKVSELAAVLN